MLVSEHGGTQQRGAVGGSGRPCADVDAAATAFLARYKGAIRWVINSFAIPAHERPDLEQSVAIRLLLRFRRYGVVPVDSPSAIGYAVTMTRNACVNHRARQRPAPGGESCAGDRAIDTTPLPDEQVVRNEAHDRLHMAVKQLPSFSRSVMELTLQGKTIKEIANYYDIKEGAARVASHRARKLLRQRLQR